MATLKNKIGFCCGVIIIILALVVFFYSIPEQYSMRSISGNVDHAPSVESNKSYGGDAYTGIQQAAAQTAYNVYAVYDAIEIQNANMIKQTKVIVDALKLFFGFTLLAVGMVLISVSFEFDEYKPQAQAYVPVPQQPVTPVVPVQQNENFFAQRPATPVATVRIPKSAQTAAEAAPAEWVCACGARNQSYVFKCSCGMNKRQAEQAIEEQQQ